jgi:hypothetical protein
MDEAHEAATTDEQVAEILAGLATQTRLLDDQVKAVNRYLRETPEVLATMLGCARRGEQAQMLLLLDPPPSSGSQRGNLARCCAHDNPHIGMPSTSPSQRRASSASRGGRTDPPGSGAGLLQAEVPRRDEKEYGFPRRRGPGRVLPG